MPCVTHTREGTWGADQGRQYSKRRDRRWRLAGVDACPGGQAVQYCKRGGYQVQRTVKISLRVAHRGGDRDTEGDGEISIKHFKRWYGDI